MSEQTLADKLLQHTVLPIGRPTLADYSPAEIRLACQELISRGQDKLAVAVGEAAYALYPGDVEILAITSLMAVAQQDWSLAIERMSELIILQGVHVQEMTYVLLARAQRCDLDPSGALRTVIKGLEYHPTSEMLQQEYTNLAGCMALPTPENAPLI